MALIPLKQTVTVHRRSDESDGWGGSSVIETFTMRCRVEERVETVRNQLGEEVVSTAQVYFDKLPDIRYDDEIEYTNEIGVTVKRSPQHIESVRMLNGRPALTIVYL